MGNQQNQDQEGKKEVEVVEKRRNGLMKGKNSILVWGIALILGAALALTIGGIYGVGALKAGENVLFLEDVDGQSPTSNVAGWTMTTGAVDWHVTTKNAVTNPQSRVYSGTKSFYFGSEATHTYAGADSGTLTSPVVSVPNAGTTATILSFWHFMHGSLVDPDDYGWVEIRTSDSNGWDTIVEYRMATADYWNYHEFNLTPYYTMDGTNPDTVQVRFIFTTDGDANTYEGWYIDDIKIAAAKVENETACHGSSNNLILDFTMDASDTGDYAVYAPGGGTSGNAIKLFSSITTDRNISCTIPGKTVRVGWADTVPGVQAFSGASGSADSIFIDWDGDGVVTRKGDEVKAGATPETGTPLIPFFKHELHVDDGAETNSYDKGEDVVIDHDRDRMVTHSNTAGILGGPDANIYHVAANLKPNKLEGHPLKVFQSNAIKQAADPGIVTTRATGSDTYLSANVDLGSYVAGDAVIIVDPITSRANDITGDGAADNYNDTALFDLVVTWGSSVIGRNPGQGDALRTAWGNGTDTQYYIDANHGGWYNGGLADTMPLSPSTTFNPHANVTDTGEVIITSPDATLDTGPLNGTGQDTVAIAGYADFGRLTGIFIVDTVDSGNNRYEGGSAQGSEALFRNTGSDTQITSASDVILAGLAGVTNFVTGDSVCFSNIVGDTVFTPTTDFIWVDTNGNNIYDISDILLHVGSAVTALNYGVDTGVPFNSTPGADRNDTGVAYLDTNSNGRYHSAPNVSAEPIIFIANQSITTGNILPDTATILAANSDSGAIDINGQWDEGTQWLTLEPNNPNGATSVAGQNLVFLDIQGTGSLNYFDSPEAIIALGTGQYVAGTGATAGQTSILTSGDTVVKGSAASDPVFNLANWMAITGLSHTDYNSNNLIDTPEQVVWDRIGSSGTVNGITLGTPLPNMTGINHRAGFFDNMIVEGPGSTNNGMITTLLLDCGDSYVTSDVTYKAVTATPAATGFDLDLDNIPTLTTRDVIAINTAAACAYGRDALFMMANDDKGTEVLANNLAYDDVADSLTTAYWIDVTGGTTGEFDLGDVIFMDANGNVGFDTGVDLVLYEPTGGANLTNTSATVASSIKGSIYSSGTSLYDANWVYYDANDNNSFDSGDDIYQNSIKLSTVFDITTVSLGSNVVTITVQNDTYYAFDATTGLYSASGNLSPAGTVLVEFNGTAEDFTDNNGNGYYDAGDTIADANGNGKWDPIELHTNQDSCFDSSAEGYYAFNCGMTYCESIVTEYDTHAYTYRLRTYSPANEQWYGVAYNVPQGTAFDGFFASNAGWVDATGGTAGKYDAGEQVWQDTNNNGVVDPPGADKLKQLIITNSGTAEYPVDIVATTGFHLYYESSDTNPLGALGFQAGVDPEIPISIDASSTAKTWVLNVKPTAGFDLSDTTRFYVTVDITSNPPSHLYGNNIVAALTSTTLQSGQAPTYWYNDIYRVTIDCTEPGKSEVVRIELPNTEGSSCNGGWAQIRSLEIDDDGDGRMDEDPIDTIDNDGDGLIDEDPMTTELGYGYNVYEVRDKVRLTFATPSDQDVRMLRVRFDSDTSSAISWTDLDLDPKDAVLGKTDGSPGVKGVDDDGDGGIDFNDPEVRAALNNPLTDGVDNDANGYIDGREPLRANGAPCDIDIDGDGIYGELAVDNGVLNDDVYVAANDDNEDGIVDEDEFFLFFTGDEPFIDVNGNNFYDAGESYVDQNGNGRWDWARFKAPYRNLTTNEIVPASSSVANNSNYKCISILRNSHNSAGVRITKTYSNGITVALPGNCSDVRANFNWVLDTVVWEKVQGLLELAADKMKNPTCLLNGGVEYPIIAPAYDNCYAHSDEDTVPVRLVIDNTAPVIESVGVEADPKGPGYYYLKAKIAADAVIGEVLDVAYVEFRVGSDSTTVCGLSLLGGTATTKYDGYFRSDTSTPISLDNYTPCGQGKVYVCATAYDRLGYAELNSRGVVTGECKPYWPHNDADTTCRVAANKHQLTVKVDASDSIAPVATITRIGNNRNLKNVMARVTQDLAIQVQVDNWAALDRDQNPRVWGPADLHSRGALKGLTWDQTENSVVYSLETLYRPMPALFKYVDRYDTDGGFNYLTDHIYYDTGTLGIVDAADTYFTLAGTTVSSPIDTGAGLTSFSYDNTYLGGVKWVDINNNARFESDTDAIVLDTNDIAEIRFQVSDAGKDNWTLLGSLNAKHYNNNLVDFAAPLVVNWNTSDKVGVYKLRAVAYDCEGNVLSWAPEVVAVVDKSCVAPHFLGFTSDTNNLDTDDAFANGQIQVIDDNGDTVSGKVQFLARTFTNEVDKVEFHYSSCIGTDTDEANVLFIVESSNSIQANHIPGISANIKELKFSSVLKAGVAAFYKDTVVPIGSGGSYMTSDQTTFANWVDTGLRGVQFSPDCYNAFTAIEKAVTFYKTNNYFDTGARIFVVLVTDEDADDSNGAMNSAITALTDSGLSIQSLRVVYDETAPFPVSTICDVGHNTTNSYADFDAAASTSIVYKLNNPSNKLAFPARSVSINGSWKNIIADISGEAATAIGGWIFLGTDAAPEVVYRDGVPMQVWRSSIWDSTQFANTTGDSGGYSIRMQAVDDMGNMCAYESPICFNIYNICPAVKLTNTDIAYVAAKNAANMGGSSSSIHYSWMDGEPHYDANKNGTIDYSVGSGEWLDVNGNNVYDTASGWVKVTLTAALETGTNLSDVAYVQYQYSVDGGNRWVTIDANPFDGIDIDTVPTSTTNSNWSMDWYTDYEFRNLRRDKDILIRAVAYDASGLNGGSRCALTAPIQIEIAENIEPIATMVEVKTSRNELIHDGDRLNACSGQGFKILAVTYDQDAVPDSMSDPGTTTDEPTDNTTIRDLELYVMAPGATTWTLETGVSISSAVADSDGDTNDWIITWTQSATSSCTEGKWRFAAVATDWAGNKTLITSEENYGDSGLDLVDADDPAFPTPGYSLYGDMEPYLDDYNANPSMATNPLGRWEGNGKTDSVYKSIIIDCLPPEATIASDAATKCFQSTFDFDIAATSAFGAFNVNAAGDSYSVVKVWMREKDSGDSWTLIATTEEEVIIDTGDMVISTRPKIGSDDVYADASYAVGVHVDSGTVIIKPGADGILQSKPGDTNGDGTPDTTGFTSTATSGDKISRISGTSSATVSITDNIVDTYTVRVTYPVPGNGIDEDGNSADKDEDGYPNGQEITAGTDPNDSTSYPAGDPEPASNYIDEDGIGGLDPGPGVEKTYEFMVTAIDRKDAFNNPGNDDYLQACYQHKIEVEVDTIRPEARIAQIDVTTGLANDIDTAQTVTVTTGEDLLITAVVDANPWNATGKYEFSGSETSVGDVIKVEFYADANGDGIYETLIGQGDNTDHAADGFSNKYSVRLTKDQLIANFGGANYYNRCYKVIAIAYDDNCASNREDKLPLNAPTWGTEDTENLTLYIEGPCDLALSLEGLGDIACQTGSDTMDNRVYPSGGADCPKVKVSGDEIDLYVTVGQGQADTSSVEISFNGGSTWEKMNYNNFDDFTFTLYEDDFPYYSTADTNKPGAQAKFEDVMVNVKSDTMTDTVSIPMSVWVNADGAHIWQSKDKVTGKLLGVLGNMIVDGGDGISHTAPLTGSDDIKVEEVGYLTSIVGADMIALILPGPDGILQSIPGDTDGDGNIDKVTTNDKYLINVPARTYTGAISTPAIFGRVGQTCRSKVKTGTDDIQVIKAGATITANTVNADSAVVIMPGPNGVIDSIAGDANGDGYLSMAEATANLNGDAKPADRTAAITYSYDFTIDAVGNDTYDQKSGQFTLLGSPVWSINKDISGLADGVYEVVVRAANTTGSCQDQISKKVIIDRTPPQLGDMKVTLETECGKVIGISDTVPIWVTVSDPSGDTNINIIDVQRVRFQWSKDGNTQDGTSMWYDIGTDDDGSNGWSLKWGVQYDPRIQNLQEGTIIHIRTIGYDDANNGALLNDGMTVTVDTVAPQAYISKATIGGKVYVSPKIDGLQFTKGDVLTLEAALSDLADSTDVVSITFQYSVGDSVSGGEVWKTIPAYTYSDSDIYGADGWKVLWDTAETNLPETADYYVQVRAVAEDCAGNRDATPVTTILLHDYEGMPSAWLKTISHACNKDVNVLHPYLAVTNTSNLKGITDGTAVMVTLEIMGSDTADTWTELGIAEVANKAFTYNWDATSLAEGIYYLRVKATDADGNTSEPTERVKIVVDHTPPVVKEFKVSTLAPNEGDSIVFTVDADATMSDADGETVEAKMVYLQYWDVQTSQWQPGISLPVEFTYSAQTGLWTYTAASPTALKTALNITTDKCEYYVRALVVDWACNDNKLDSIGIDSQGKEYSGDTLPTAVKKMQLDTTAPTVEAVYAGNRYYEGGAIVACGGDEVDVYVKLRKDDCSGIDESSIKFFYRESGTTNEWKEIKYGASVTLEDTLTEGTTGYEYLYATKWITPPNQKKADMAYVVGAYVADEAANDTYSWKTNKTAGVRVETDCTAPSGTTVTAADIDNSHLCGDTSMDGIIDLKAYTTGHADDYRPIYDTSVDDNFNSASVEFYYQSGGTWTQVYGLDAMTTLKVSTDVGDKVIAVVSTTGFTVDNLIKIKSAGQEEVRSIKEINGATNEITVDEGLSAEYDAGCATVYELAKAGYTAGLTTALAAGADSDAGTRVIALASTTGLVANDTLLITGGSNAEIVKVVSVTGSLVTIDPALTKDYSNWPDTVSVIKAGYWSIKLDTRELADGTYKIAARAIDWAGHEEDMTTLTTTTIVIDNPKADVRVTDAAKRSAERGKELLIEATPDNDSDVAAVAFWFTADDPTCDTAVWRMMTAVDTSVNMDTNLTEGKYAFRWNTKGIPLADFMDQACNCYADSKAFTVIGIAWDDDCGRGSDDWPYGLTDSDTFSRAMADGRYITVYVTDTTAPKITLTQISYTSQCDVSDTLDLPEEAEDMIIGGLVTVTAESEEAADDLNIGSAHVRFMYRLYGTTTWTTIDMDPIHTYGDDTDTTSWKLTGWDTLAPKLNGVYEVGIEATDVFGNTTKEVYPFKVKIDNEKPTNVKLTLSGPNTPELSSEGTASGTLERGDRVVLKAETDGAEMNDVRRAAFYFRSHTAVSDPEVLANWNIITNTFSSINPDTNYPYAITWRTGLLNSNDTLVVGGTYDIKVVVTDRVGCTAEAIVTVTVEDNVAKAIISRIITDCDTYGDCENLDSVRVNGLVNFQAQVDDDVQRLIWKYRKVGAASWITAADDGRTEVGDNGFMLAAWDVTTLDEGQYEMIVVATSDLGFTDVNKVIIKFIVDHEADFTAINNSIADGSAIGFADDPATMADEGRIDLIAYDLKVIDKLSDGSPDIHSDSTTGWYDGVTFGFKLCSDIDTGTASWNWFNTAGVYDDLIGYFSLGISKDDFRNAGGLDANCCYDFAIKLRDQACNENYSVIAENVTVDNLDPKACITAINEDTTLEDAVDVSNKSATTIRMTAFDACTAVTKVQFQISDTNTSAYNWRDVDVVLLTDKTDPNNITITWNTTGMPRGNYWLRVVATDQVGNIGSGDACIRQVTISDKLPPVAVICGYDDYQVRISQGFSGGQQEIDNIYVDAIYAVTYCPDVVQVQFQSLINNGQTWTNIGFATNPVAIGDTPAGRDKYAVWKVTWIPEAGNYLLRALPKDRSGNRDESIAPVTEIVVTAAGQVTVMDVANVTLGDIKVAAHLIDRKTLEITVEISGDKAPLKTVLVVVEDAQDNVYEEIIEVFPRTDVPNTYVGVTTRDLATIAHGGTITVYTAGTDEFGKIGGISEYALKTMKVYLVTRSLGTNGPVTINDLTVAIPGNYGGNNAANKTGLLILPTITPVTSAGQARHITPVGQAYQVVLLSEPDSPAAFVRGYEPRVTIKYPNDTQLKAAGIDEDNLSVRYWNEGVVPELGRAGWDNDKIVRVKQDKVNNTLTFDVSDSDNITTLTDIYSVVRTEKSYIRKIVLNDNAYDQVTYIGDPLGTIYVRNRFDTITVWVVEGDGVDTKDIESVELTIDNIPVANATFNNGVLNNDIRLGQLNLTNLWVKADVSANRAGIFPLTEGKHTLNIYIRSKSDKTELTYDQPFVVDMTPPFTVLDGDYYYKPGTKEGVISAIFVDQGCGVDLSNIRLDVWKYLTDLTGANVPGVDNDGEDQGNIINYQRKVLLKTVLGKNGGLIFQYSDDYTNDGVDNETWQGLQTTWNYKNHPAWRVSYKYNDGNLKEGETLQAVFYFGDHENWNNLADTHNEHFNWYFAGWSGPLGLVFDATINDASFDPFQAYYINGTLNDMLGNTGHCDPTDTVTVCADWVARNYIVEKAGPVTTFDLPDTTNLSSRPTICATVVDRASGVSSVTVYLDGGTVSSVTRR
ncbi:MAG: Ig-like domain-containing protein, partial [bacterium]|nr:Ig-like domain-containing protein [bacterium]